MNSESRRVRVAKALEGHIPRFINIYCKEVDYLARVHNLSWEQMYLLLDSGGGAGAEEVGSLPLDAVVNVQQMAQKAVELGSQQLAPVLGAAALRGAALQIALNPTAVFQGALGLLSAPALTPEQKQQQQRDWLRDAAQETFGTEVLSQLPPSLQWLAPTLALPGVAAGQPAVLGAVEAEVQARQTTGGVS